MNLMKIENGYGFTDTRSIGTIISQIIDVDKGATSYKTSTGAGFVDAPHKANAKIFEK